MIASSALLALLGGAVQLRVTRTHARQARVYDYSDRFNAPEIIELCARYTEYWKAHSYADFSALQGPARARLLIVPNLIEEVAALYNRKLLDRDVAAEALGMYVEEIWIESLPLVTGARIQRNNPWIYCEWDAMRRDTVGRQLTARRRIDRRQSWRRLWSGDGSM